MTVFTTIAFAAFLLKHNHLVTFYKRSKNFAYNFGTVNGRSSHLYCAIGFREKNTVEFNLVTFLGLLAEIMNIQELLGLCLELLSLNFYNCVHY
mgnify:CR=1 FL=1